MLPPHCSAVIHHTAAQQRRAITTVCMLLCWRSQYWDLSLPMLHPQAHLSHCMMVLCDMHACAERVQVQGCVVLGCAGHLLTGYTGQAGGDERRRTWRRLLGRRLPG